MSAKLLRDNAEKRGFRTRFIKKLLSNIKYRCTNPRDGRYKYYGGRGIKCLLSVEDLEVIYERDRPDLMVKPSIDRRANDGHYEFSNCQFIELADNIAKSKRRQYPCVGCGVVARPLRRNGKTWCENCVKSEKYNNAKYAEYVNFVIQKCRDRGFDIAPVFTDRGKKVSTHRLCVNGTAINICYATKAWKTSPQSCDYWQFYPSFNADIQVLVAKYRDVYQAWILVEKPHLRILYIPVVRSTNQRGPRPRYDWPALKNAWHLLAPAQ